MKLIKLIFLFFYCFIQCKSTPVYVDTTNYIVLNSHDTIFFNNISPHHIININFKRKIYIDSVVYFNKNIKVLCLRGEIYKKYGLYFYRKVLDGKLSLYTNRWVGKENENLHKVGCKNILVEKDHNNILYRLDYKTMSFLTKDDSMMNAYFMGNYKLKKYIKRTMIPGVIIFPLSFGVRGLMYLASISFRTNELLVPDLIIFNSMAVSGISLLSIGTLVSLTYEKMNVEKVLLYNSRNK